MRENILYIQFANSMFLRHGSCDHYWDVFYNKWKNEGYYRPGHVFELPKWIAEISYFCDIYNQEVFWCEHNVNEAIDKVKHEKFKHVLMSLMTANQYMIENVVKSLPEQNFIIGGYDDKFLAYLGTTYENVNICETTEDTARFLGVPFMFGTDYTLFRGATTVPRLTLSYGCLNRCKFCIVPHGKIVNVDEKYIRQQVESFSDLEYRLIYIDDKTFGQATNYTLLSEMKDNIVSGGMTRFNGFIVQTTTGMVIKKAKEFADIGIKVVEIGLETFNDSILKAYNKPSTEKRIVESIEIGNACGLKMLPNIIIGLPEETEETYQKTYDFVMPLLESGQIIGINPAIYTDYSSEDCLGEIDFLADEKIEIHRKWWNKFNFTAAEILSKKK